MATRRSAVASLPHGSWLRALPFCLGLPLCLIWLSGAALAAGRPAPDKKVRSVRPDLKRIQDVVDELRTELEMPHEVLVTVVPENALVVSVESIPDRRGAFLISFEAGFLDALDEDELRAVVAHELGHVWIFTHHPYLQTEQLANQIAMRLVSRDTLVQVYGKVWAARGTKGDLARFLGPEHERSRHGLVPSRSEPSTARPRPR